MCCMSVVLLVCGCTNASLDFSETFCFRAAFHPLGDMRCGSNVNIFVKTHFSVLFLLSYIAILKDTYSWENKKNICDFLCVKERSYDCRQLV